MNVELYKNGSPPNVLNKSLSRKCVVPNVRFVESESLSITKPKIIIDFSSSQITGLHWDNDIGDIVPYNYCYIPKLDRYYYIDNIFTQGALVVISCRVDVLMSHSKDILRSSQYVLRQETKYHNAYLYDELLPITSQHNYLFDSFGDDVDDRTCGRVILATSGKGGTII